MLNGMWISSGLRCWCGKASFSIVEVDGGVLHGDADSLWMPTKRWFWFDGLRSQLMNWTGLSWRCWFGGGCLLRWLNRGRWSWFPLWFGVWWRWRGEMDRRIRLWGGLSFASLSTESSTVVWSARCWPVQEGNWWWWWQPWQLRPRNIPAKSIIGSIISIMERLNRSAMPLCWGV